MILTLKDRDIWNSKIQYFPQILQDVYLQVQTSNEIAVKLYKGVGFVQEGIVREEVYKNNQYYDMVMKSILKKEFVQ